MKFDSLMNFLYRVLCVAVSAIVVIGCVVSCTSINARAWEPGQDPVYWAQQAKDFQEQLEQELVETEQAILQDINDGTLDNTSELYQQRLKALAIQKICESNPLFYGIYHGADLALQGIPSEYFDSPSEISVSGSGIIGMYLDNNNDLQFANFYKPDDGQLKDPIVICSSPDFTFTLSSDNPINVTGVLNNGFCGISYWLSYSYSGYSHRVCTGTISGSVNEVTYGSSYVNGFGVSITNVGSSIPRLADMNPNSYSVTVAKLGSNFTYPSGEFESDKPYEYYNNVVLPYIRENFPDIPESDIVFPFGYQIIEPTEPPTTPNGGIYIDKQVNIGINIFTPTDASGQPITNASGETVTETQYVTATYPPDGEYRFQIPTIEPLNLYEATVPNPDLSPFTDGFSFIWNATYHFFNDTGFMPVVMACLSLSVIGYIIWKVGG